MPSKQIFRIFATPLVAVLMLTAHTADAARSPADTYLALKHSLGTVSYPFSTLKTNAANCIGKTFEVTGKISGIMNCGNSISFVLECEGENLVVGAEGTVPDCVSNGNTVRALLKIGDGCLAGLTDLHLQAVAYDYDVAKREQELAPKPKPKSKAKRTQSAPSPLINRGSNPKTFNGRIYLSSRAMEVYEPYRAAIAKFNPRLTPDQVQTITSSVLGFSEHYGIDPRLVIALFIAESGFRPTATSRTGAMGLGQLMPGTARGLGVGNAYDPVQNIEGSIRLIRGHLAKYGDLALALSAYNAGPGAVKKYGGVPPYRETRSYVKRVASLYKALCGQ